MTTITIDRVRIPAKSSDDPDNLDERELAYDEKSERLMFKVNGKTRYIPFEDKIIDQLHQKIVEYIETKSFPIPVVDSLEVIQNPVDGMLCYCNNQLYVYLRGHWWKFTSE